MNLNELQDICETLGLPIEGFKHELIERILTVTSMRSSQNDDDDDDVDSSEAPRSQPQATQTEENSNSTSIVRSNGFLYCVWNNFNFKSLLLVVLLGAIFVLFQMFGSTKEPPKKKGWFASFSKTN
jgi:hypothetical protein